MSTEEQQQHEAAIMEALTNISGHLHMLNGWVDSLWPYKQVLHVHDPKLMPQLIKARGEGMIAVKLLAKRLIRDDDKAIDLMFESIGKELHKCSKMSIDKRNEVISKIVAISVE